MGFGSGSDLVGADTTLAFCLGPSPSGSELVFGDDWMRFQICQQMG